MVEKLYREAAVERAMKVQEVLMRAMAKQMSTSSTSRIGLSIERFLAHKRTLGRTYCREAFLREIDRFAQREDSDFLSGSLARD